MKKFFLLMSIVLLTTAQSIAQPGEAQIDSLILNVLNDRSGPGGVFMIAREGKPIYHKAFGKANLELNVELTPEYVFQIGSMTKQFTAIAVLMLEEEGKLKVSDSIAKYIPDYPSGDKITIHHLLTHTSGIKSFTKMKGLSEIAQKEMTPEMMVNFFKNEAADFAPGEKFEYNNSGYVLLGHLIEIVSGESYKHFIEARIFAKAGMTQSRYASDQELIPKRAYGYHKRDGKYVNKTVINYSVPFSSGSLMSTTTDMLKWQNALNSNLLISAATSEKVFRPYQLTDGSEVTYGYGWHIKKLDGVAIREHGGSIFGYKAMGLYIPAYDMYVLGMVNCDANSPTQLVRDIATLIVKALGNLGLPSQK